jgi:hypothetical protein
MAQREAIEAALAAWRHALRLESAAIDGDRAALTHEVEVHRTEFQRLSANHMVEWIAKLQAAERRRSTATPSTAPFHEAARETEEIAAEIWESARVSDEDTPQTAANQRTSPRSGRARSQPRLTAPIVPD